MKDPWFFLINNEIPTYTIETEDSIIGKDGTKIIIEGYLVDNPEKYYNLETIKDYILWFTAGGSFKNIFATYPELNCYVKNMQIAPRIFINDCILDIREEIAGAHQFFPPQENPLVDNNEKIYKRSVNYCRHFGPYHRSTNINGEYVSFQMYGTVSGVNCRKAICKLRQSERLKGRFGIYLAKDFIPFTKKSSLISDPNYHHFHILVNSQNFELTADRNNVSNDDDPKVKWIYLMVKEIINNDKDFLNELIDKVNNSIQWVNENNKEAADYSVENGSQVEASIIEKSIKNSNINFSNSGDSKQDYLEYFKVLENENAKSIGEKIPNEDFFYEG